MSVAGVVNTQMREVAETLYQYKADYVFDSSNFEARFSFTPTSYERGIEKALRQLGSWLSPIAIRSTSLPLNATAGEISRCCTLWVRQGFGRRPPPEDRPWRQGHRFLWVHPGMHLIAIGADDPGRDAYPDDRR